MIAEDDVDRNGADMCSVQQLVLLQAKKKTALSECMCVCGLFRNMYQQHINYDVQERKF